MPSPDDAPLPPARGAKPLAPAVLALAFALALAACDRAEPPARPNVLLIVIDTLRADHVLDPDGAVATPAIDALARDGVSFPRAFSHIAWTLPSHTTLFSSRHPHETGVLLNAQRVPADLPLLAEWLGARGWRTEAVVSLCSLIPAGDLVRIDRGFEAYDDRMLRVLNPADLAIGHVRAALDRVAADPRPFFLFAHFADPHQPYTAHGTVEAPARVLRRGPEGEEDLGAVPNLAGFAPFQATLALPPGETELVVRAASPFHVRYAGARAGERRLETRFDDVHGGREIAVAIENPDAQPLEAEIEIWAWDAPDEAESRRRYALEVEFVDRHVGALLDDLRARGLYDDTLIVLTADHGEGLGEHGLLDHGLSCFDEQIHVPLIVKPPAGHPARAALERAAAGLARHVDVAPTILHLVDAPALPGAVGTSLAEEGDRVLLAETHALAVDDYFALRDERWKLCYAPERDQLVLFDLERDPDEMQPLLEFDEQRFADWIRRLRAVAEASADAADVDRSADPETRARLKAMGYF